ncbi:XrtN system VIT domain-containing protein [Chitinophaga polysaccharea]|uniref:XrtN system VIT domain-containing protein n=1 Tax=Chitinophaga polysaccharea TaxID=1293035 RepID=UPI0014556A15|nr:XrtN system VIT domain-containing protein [Chitinophaga polysaccharea]NLR58585.1 XrtN system VIT domain-containing protein [Chitinophaga polysaccharea]
MEAAPAKRLPEPFLLGLVLLTVSLPLFVTSCYVVEDKAVFAFLINHLIALFYFLALWWSGALKAGPNRRKVTAAAFVLLFIDAYTVNNVFSVFQTSAPWFVVVLVLLCANTLAFGYFDSWPEWVRLLQCAVLGFTFLAPVYLAIYLLPLYIISLIALIAIGISVVTFTPILLCWFNLRMVQQEVWKVKRYRLTYLFSGAAALLLTAAYVIVYGMQVKAIDDSEHLAISQNNGMPVWMKTAQTLPRGPLVEKILKTDLVYVSPVWTDASFWDVPDRRYDHELIHDPLFVTASALFGRTTISGDDRLNILNVIYDKRHYTEERLWSGNDLVTTRVATTADIWPQYHLAYTEHTLTVANHDERTWTRDEEAIYTFHLPQGAVVTSLSLWINGREEKGVPTTRQKATQAYKQIVGVERHDPSVVHWQEGDRVVVRVFPVPAAGERKFKIGITSPLSVEKGQLCYQPAWFEGPPHEDASYEANLHMDRWPAGITLPPGFRSGSQHTITRKGDYDANWELRFPSIPMDNAAFNFNGLRYTLLPYTPNYEIFLPADYYLDLNCNWRYEDYRKILLQLKGKAVWVFHPVNGKTAVTDNNQQTLFNQLQQARFSLFPFHQLPEAANALVITASDNISPQLKDLDSSFREPLLQYLAHQPVRVYNIGATISPYLATLRESRSLIYDHGTTEELLRQLKQQRFLRPEADSADQVIAHAGMRIVSSADNAGNTGPDHLARLFAYNQVLQQMGRQVATDSSALINTAAKAYIVTPLSSLVVLESAQDYKRFDIKEDLNSLQNATLKSHGAVPEPHEWALFIIAVLILAYVRFEKVLFRRKKTVC